MSETISLNKLLQKYSSEFSKIIPQDLNATNVCRLDLTAANPLLDNKDLKDTRAFDALIKQLLKEQNAAIGVGGYLENRVIYRRSEHFSEQEANRSIHLGVDIWTDAFTPVLAPLHGKLHSFQDNNNFGDYGPTIILEHKLEGVVFYTLYGHLTCSSLNNLEVGQVITKGQEFTQIGPFPENGDWPPHLHFQLMTDMLGLQGDFPGVCTQKQEDKFSKICLNPNLILNCKYLN